MIEPTQKIRGATGNANMAQPRAGAALIQPRPEEERTEDDWIIQDQPPTPRAHFLLTRLRLPRKS
jgi:hypothetical protein